MPGAKVVVQFVDAKVGGRQGPTFLVKAYRPHFRVGDGDYLGVAFSGENSSEPIQPGTCVSAEVAFVYAPGVDYSALSAGVQFRMLEGTRTVGVGVVIELTP
jgi:translation elongation factor EF-Tu-like GTPase